MGVKGARRQSSLLVCTHGRCIEFRCPAQKLGRRFGFNRERDELRSFGSARPFCLMVNRAKAHKHVPSGGSNLRPVASRLPSRMSTEQQLAAMIRPSAFSSGAGFRRGNVLTGGVGKSGACRCGAGSLGGGTERTFPFSELWGRYYGRRYCRGSRQARIT
jgi:hypothetical protein